MCDLNVKKKNDFIIMNMKKIFSLVLLLTFAISMWGISLPDSLNYTFRIGYNIGGTAPVGMPATIRKLNSYRLPA